MMICRANSRTSAPSFTNKLQRKPAEVRKADPVHNQDLSRADALKQLNKVAANVAVMATLSTRSSKSWTKTKRSDE